MALAEIELCLSQALMRAREADNGELIYFLLMSLMAVRLVRSRTA